MEKRVKRVVFNDVKSVLVIYFSDGNSEEREMSREEFDEIVKNRTLDKLFGND